MTTAARKLRRASPILLGFGLLIGMVSASLWLAREQTADNVEAGRLFDYQQALLETLSAVKDAEIGQRGFLLTRERRYLVLYRSGAARSGRATSSIQTLGGAQGAALAAKLEPLIDAKFAEMETTLELAFEGREAEALAIMRTDNGVELMDEIRALLSAQRETNRASLHRLQLSGAARMSYLNIGLLAGLMILFATALFWSRSQRRQLAELRLALEETEAASSALRAEVAARKEAEGALRQLQKMESIGQLTGGIAHDFNNMLAIVLGNLDLAERRIDDPKKALLSLSHAREGAERAATLTARLLAFARQQPLAPETVDANKLVTSMSELLRRTLGERIKVETVLGGGLWRCHADIGQLENAIVNLAVNARDAMLDGGRLTIETANAHLDDLYVASHEDVTPGQYIAICVTDTGAGMSARVVERAFDPFFTTKPVGKGTGLGLSQVFGFVKQTGGHVAVYSEVGEGTTIKLYLPRFFGSSEPIHRSSEMIDETPTGRADEKILVVEDEQRVRHFSVDALRELGYSAVSAATPSEALAMLDSQPDISLLFTDVVMPEMDGRRLADAALQKRPSLKILYTTGYTRNAVVHNGRLDAGVNFLAKPYSVAQLARKVRGILDG